MNNYSKYFGYAALCSTLPLYHPHIWIVLRRGKLIIKFPTAYLFDSREFGKCTSLKNFEVVTVKLDVGFYAIISFYVSDLERH